ncbi:MAG: RdgB/HAM1 family non-canonical purine NTP pyrophosphatase [Candidatus Pelagibacter sp.]|tara:strand:+ start:443 stop:1045 length:603 start_codon:yes stop_codon:yes gene_type:complete
MKNKKISKILIGTNNQGKLREITNLLPKKVKVFSTKDFNLKSPKETGKTFKSNALIKAKYFSKKTNLICLSDDSGLEIDILKKKPGIYSARWGGKNSDFNKAMQRVYKELDKKDEEWKAKKISARFICALVIYWPNRKKIYSVGKISGKISKIKKGKNGFGYDPIFIPNGHKRTFAEMSKIYKYKIDHRAKAFNKIKRFF